MPISFSSSGSTAGTPTKGLLGNNSLGMNLYKPKQQVQTPQVNTPQNPGKVTGVLAPNVSPTALPAFVPGTQKPLPNPFNRTVSASDVPGTPTASGNSKLQGADYFQGLINSQNPAERQAGQTWLSHQVNPGLLPDTSVKKITTNADGTTTHEFHAPDTSNNDSSKNSNSPTPPPGITPSTQSLSSNSNTTAPSGFQVGTPKQNAQNVLDVSSLNNNPEYQTLAKQNADLVKAGGVASQASYAGQNNSIGQSLADADRPQSTGNLAGELGNLNNQISQGLSGNAAEATRLISGAQLATGGAENVLGASTYSPTSYGQTNTSGLTGVQDSGNYGTGPGAAANVQSIKDLTGQYNQGLVNLKAADGIQNQITNTLQTNPSLNNIPVSALTNLNELLSGEISSGPQQLLSQQVHQYITTLGLDPATVVNIAHQQQGTLAQLLDSLRQTAQTQNEAKNPANLPIPGSNSNTSSSSAGERLYNF